MKQEIFWLIHKEITLERRNRYAFNSILLYLVSTTFVSYMAFAGQSRQLNPASWNALLWIILLFTAMNTVAKSFAQESEGRQLYYYTLANAESIIVAKIIYNTLLLTLMSGIGFGIYALLLGNIVQDSWLFMLNMALGSIGFAATLTLVSAIAAKARNNTTLMAILSFPVVLPMLLMLIKVSKNAIDGLSRNVSFDEIITILAVNLIVLSISYLLFPYLWRS